MAGGKHYLELAQIFDEKLYITAGNETTYVGKEMPSGSSGRELTYALEKKIANEIGIKYYICIVR